MKRFYALLLALCAISAVMSEAEFERRMPKGASRCSPDCVKAVKKSVERNDCKLPDDGATWTEESAFKYTSSEGTVESIRVDSVCFGYQLCNRCGVNGRCEVKKGRARCKCNDQYGGERCDKKSLLSNTMILAISILGGVLAFFILVAICAHVFCAPSRRKRRKKRCCSQKPQMVRAQCSCAPPPAPMPCQASCMPTSCHGGGHPVLSGSCNACPGFQPCRPAPAPTCTLTELPNCASVVPVGGGFFPAASNQTYSVLPTAGGTVLTIS